MTRAQHSRCAWISGGLCALLVGGLLSVSWFPHTEPQDDPIVYVTRTGRRYHTATCQDAASVRPVPLSQAVDFGLTACSLCDPPRPKDLSEGEGPGAHPSE